MAGVAVGLKDLHYAVLTDDSAGAATYDVPVGVTGAITATITPTTNSATLYADDGASETASALGEITVAVNVKDLPKSAQADLLGHTIGADGVLYKSSDDVAPYVAVGFRSVKSNGEYRYTWLYKGKFQPSEQSFQTKGDTPAFQTPTINGIFVKRDADNRWQTMADTDDADITDQTIFDNWFTAVHEEGTGTV